MLVKFLKDYNGYQKEGEILEMGEPLAKLLISEKVVELVTENENEKEVPKKQKKQK